MVKKLLARPYHMLLLTGFLLFILSFFHSNDDLDIHLHDTYLVLNRSFIYLAFALFFGLFWATYHLIYPLLFSNKLIWVHIIGTIVSIVGTFLYTAYQISYFTRRYYDFSYWEESTLVQIRVIAGLIIAIQLLYPINLALGIIKRIKK